MKNLLVIYDSSSADNGTYSYMNVIKKYLNDVVFLDISTVENIKRINLSTNLSNISSYIILKPMNKDLIDLLNNKLYTEYHLVNLEKVSSLTITSEAILQEIPEDLKGKIVMVINQSETIGKSIFKGLIKRYATVISCNVYTDINYFTEKDIIPDILITATGNRDIKLDQMWTDKIKKIIDLSEDTCSKKAVRKINTVNILKRRFENVNILENKFCFLND